MSVLGKRFAVFAILAVGGACSSKDYEVPNEATMVEDANIMRGLMQDWWSSHPGEAAMKLDLSDSRQARWMRNRLLFQGRTPRTSPRLFALLDHPSSGPTRSRVSGADDTASTTEEGFDCAHILPVTDDRSTVTSLRFDDALLASCFGGADYVYGDIIAFLMDGAGTTVYSTLDSASGDETASLGDTADTGGVEPVGIDFSSVEVSITTPIKVNRDVYMESLFVAVDDTTGEMWATVATLIVPTATTYMELNLEHPVDLVPNTYDVDDESTRVCLERTSAYGRYQDCDYATIDAHGDPVWVYAAATAGMAPIDTSVTTTWEPEPGVTFYPDTDYDVTRLYVPIAFTYSGLGPTASYSCGIKEIMGSTSAPAVADPSATIVMVEGDGGYCDGETAYSAGEEFQQALLDGMVPADLDGDGDFDEKASFLDVSFLANFGRDCVEYEQDAKLSLNARASLTCYNTKTKRFVPRFDQIDIYVDPIDFKNSCFAEGTAILMADGESVPVETVEVGDEVISSEGGRVMTVTGLFRGAESKPLVVITDERGETLRLTETHPVVSGSGRLVRAVDLLPGDVVLTDEGPMSLVSVAREDYQGMVYNLAVGEPEELRGLGPWDSTVVAEGFIVGDDRVQWKLAQSDHKARARVSEDY